MKYLNLYFGSKQPKTFKVYDPNPIMNRIYSKSSLEKPQSDIDSIERKLYQLEKHQVANDYFDVTQIPKKSYSIPKF